MLETGQGDCGTQRGVAKKDKTLIIQDLPGFTLFLLIRLKKLWHEIIFWRTNLQ